MENASKALLIAGGVLLALLTISLFMYMMQDAKTISFAQNKKQATEQLAKFNAEYEAFNKKYMYGADICTLLNKAIEYNGGLNVADNMFFIDIELTVTQDFKSVKTEETKNSSGKVTIKKETLGDSSLNKGTYNLKSSPNKMNTELVNFFNSDVDIKKETGGVTIYNAISDFRKAIFSCTNIEYSSETGQVNKITIEQKKETTY